MGTRRTVNGHLGIDALRSGMKEQYAVQRKRGTVIIELEITETGAIVVSETLRNGTESTWKGTTFAALSEARKAFKRLILNNP